MRWKKLTALILGAALLNSCTMTPVYANIPVEAENEAAELVEPENPVRITEDINAGTDTTGEVTYADGKEDPGIPLTPEGNMTLQDDIITESGKQFITITSRDGHYYYLIIDRSNKEKNNVYFLNMVDERDLMSLMNDDDRERLEKEKQEEAERIAREEAEKKEAEEAERKAAEKEAEKERAAKEAEKPQKRTIMLAGYELSYGMIAAAAAAVCALLIGIGMAIVFRNRKRDMELPDPDSEYEDIYDDEYDSEDGEDAEDESAEEAEFYGEDERTAEGEDSGLKGGHSSIDGEVGAADSETTG